MPWIRSYLFENDKILVKSALHEQKNVIIKNFSTHFDALFQAFNNQDIKDSLNTGNYFCDYRYGYYNPEFSRVKKCISGVKGKNVLSNHRHYDMKYESLPFTPNLNSTQSKFKNWQTEQEDYIYQQEQNRIDQIEHENR